MSTAHLDDMAAHIELPFLYQTRTILRWRPRVRRRLANRRALSSQPQPHPETTSDTSTPDSYSYDGQGGFLKEKARQVAESSKAPAAIRSRNPVGTRINSTITASERRAFETILRFTPKQAEPSSVKQQSPFVDAGDTDIENILNIFSSSIKSHQAEQNERKLHKAVKAPSDPEPLKSPNDQAIATQAEGHALAVPSPDIASLDDLTQSPELFKFDESIQQAVRARMKQIYDALHAAATSTTKRGDIATWEVCEAHVFSIASQLAPPPRATTTQAKSTEPPRFTFTKSHSDNPSELLEAASRTGEPASPSSITAPSSTSSSLSDSLPVLHHVYPAALLLALRLYIQHFPASPLAHNLLPRIRSFGHTSYVLGAGPQFYNSLISLVWLTRSSLRQVDGLLAEMERGGVELTEETYRILRQIENERAADLGREQGNAGVLRGSRGAAWWKRHEQVFWFPRILDWLAVVAKRLTLKEMGDTY
ncbi:hypothetical protein ABEF93_008200 [Exophiala dermatitidis]